MSDIWIDAALFIIGMLAGICLSMSGGVIWRQDMAMSDVKSDLLENCIKERTRLRVELRDARAALGEKNDN